MLPETPSPIKVDKCVGTSKVLMKSQTILLVGSNPSVRASSNEAFTPDTASGRLLRSWLQGIDGMFLFENISSQKTDKNRPLTTAEIAAAETALATRIQELNVDRVVALGKSASAVLSRLNIDHLAMPHPSGLNRQLNDKDFIAQKIQELKLFCERQ